MRELFLGAFIMTRILIVSYSQSGQLTRILESIIRPLEELSSVEIVWEKLRPTEPYPFPWPFIRFLDVFPESVCMIPPELEPVSFDPDEHFDLVILAYQVWYLSPSLPITGFLYSDAARVLEDTPVITVIGCRDMWLMAQEKVKERLKELGAKLIDNVVFTDQGRKVFTFITTPRWLIWGKKEGFWGIFPPAGVSEEDIKEAKRFGKAIARAIRQGELERGHSILYGLGAVKVNPDNIRMERIARRDFLFWAKLIRRIGFPGQRRRYPLLILFMLYLMGVVVLSIPFTLFHRFVVMRFQREALENLRRYFEEPSGSSTERIKEFI